MPRAYAPIFARWRTRPFDLTLTFCDVRPLSEKDIASAEVSQTVRAPVVARIALPFGVVAGLVTALQEQMRAVQEPRSRRRRRIPAPGKKVRRISAHAMAPQRRGRRTVATAGRPKRRPTRAPGLPPKAVLAIFDTLDQQHPNADTELHYRNPYGFSSPRFFPRKAPERVNIVTPPLFERYPNAAALASATTAELEPQIRASGFFLARSRPAR